MLWIGICIGYILGVASVFMASVVGDRLKRERKRIERIGK
jgi:hypothetical protein